jgi:hypothetical protein
MGDWGGSAGVRERKGIGRRTRASRSATWTREVRRRIFVDRRERRRGESSRAVEGGRRRALRCEKLGLMREANNLAPSRPAKLLHRVL